MLRSPSGAPLNLLDPFLYAGNPYPAYQWLRDEAPAYWDSVNEIWGISPGYFTRTLKELWVEVSPSR